MRVTLGILIAHLLVSVVRGFIIDFFDNTNQVNGISTEGSPSYGEDTRRPKRSIIDWNRKGKILDNPSDKHPTAALVSQMPTSYRVLSFGNQLPLMSKFNKKEWIKSPEKGGRIRREISDINVGDSTIEIELEHAKSRRRRQFLEAANQVKFIDPFPVVAEAVRLDDSIIELINESKPLNHIQGTENPPLQKTTALTSTPTTESISNATMNSSEAIPKNNVSLALQTTPIPEIMEPALKTSLTPMLCGSVDKHNVTAELLGSMPDSQRVEVETVPSKVKKIGKRQRRMRNILKSVKGQPTDDLQIQVIE